MMKLALNNLFKQKNLMIIYGLTITLVAAICFVFLAMLYDPYLQLDTTSVDKMYMGSATTLLVLIFSVCLMIYTNMYVLEAKNKEMSLLVFHGLTLKKMIFYQFYQSIFMYILFGTLGIALGYKLTPVIFKNIYYKLHYVYDIKIINQSFYQAIYMLLMMLFISLVLNIGYVYRGRLTSMMSNTRQKNYRKKNVFQITSKIYPILFILGLVMMFTTEHIASGYIVFSVIGALGGYGTVRYFSPEYIEKLKASKWLNNSQRLVVFGELYLKFKYIGIFLELLILVSIIITTLICFNLNNLIEMYRMIIAYIIIIPMIVFCITYKNLIISKKNVKNQNCIYKLGITKKYQKKFIKEETLIMYGILFILPMTYMISTLGRFYVYDGISILIIAFIIGYFILNLLISMYISYKVTTQFFRGGV